MKSFNRNLKAISPIFATLILIAIAVIAGVVVYMFTSGTLATMTGGGTAGQEKISIQAVQVNSGVTGAVSITVYAQSQGDTVTITDAIIKNSGGSVVDTITLATDPVDVETTLTEVPITGIGITDSGIYTVTLISANGGNFVSPSFTVTVVAA